MTQPQTMTEDPKDSGINCNAESVAVDCNDEVENLRSSLESLSKFATMSDVKMTREQADELDALLFYSPIIDPHFAARILGMQDRAVLDRLRTFNRPGPSHYRVGKVGVRYTLRDLLYFKLKLQPYEQIESPEET